MGSDIQSWKDQAAAWRDEYMKMYTGGNARNAVDDALAFHEKQFEPLREKYAGNSIAMHYLHDGGSRVGNSDLNFMGDYAKAENDKFVESYLSGEEKETRGIFTSPYSSDYLRKEAYVNYVFKAENWRISRGESPEAIGEWKENFRKDLVSEALHASFDRMLAEDPKKALRLLHLAGTKSANATGDGQGADAANGGEQAAGEGTFAAQGGAATSDQSGDQNSGQGGGQGNAQGATSDQSGAQDDDAQFRKMASEYSQFIPPEQLQLMQNRAEAEQQNRLRLTEDRAATIHSQVDATLLRSVEGGDL